MRILLFIALFGVQALAQAPQNWTQIAKAKKGDSKQWEMLGAWRSLDETMEIGVFKYFKPLKEYQYFGFNERDLVKGQDPSVFPVRFEELPEPWAGVRVVFNRELEEGLPAREFWIIEGRDYHQFVTISLKRDVSFDPMGWDLMRFPPAELSTAREKSRAKVKELNESLKKLLKPLKLMRPELIEPKGDEQDKL